MLAECAQRPTERQLLADHRDLRVGSVSSSHSIGLQEATSGDDTRRRFAFVVLFDQCHVDVTPERHHSSAVVLVGRHNSTVLAGANTVSLPSSHRTRSPAEVLASSTLPKRGGTPKTLDVTSIRSPVCTFIAATPRARLMCDVDGRSADRVDQTANYRHPNPMDAAGHLSMAIKPDHRRTSPNLGTSRLRRGSPVTPASATAKTSPSDRPELPFESA